MKSRLAYSRYLLPLILLVLAVVSATLAVHIAAFAAYSVNILIVPTDGTEPLPPGTSIQTMLSNMVQPVDLAFDPQGRLFYIERTRAVRLFANGVLQATPVITFSVDPSGERGLLGVAVDPDFNNDRYVFVHYTCSPTQGCNPAQNKVARFTENNGVGSKPRPNLT